MYRKKHGNLTNVKQPELENLPFGLLKKEVRLPLTQCCAAQAFCRLSGVSAEHKGGILKHIYLMTLRPVPLHVPPYQSLHSSRPFAQSLGETLSEAEATLGQTPCAE